MHAVIYDVEMKKDWEGDADAELDFVVNMSKETPGFVRGIWLTDGASGLSIQLFDSEETARGVAANASMPPDASVTLRSADVYEVLREAP
ncbi:MAG: hypothetical protein H0U21_05860 [Acidimicrobiia bacterium]|nr:hypothetical protein [Acidimicrobiia bacterium]